MRTEAHPHFERQETTDPITGHTIADTDGYPWLQEGDPDNGLTIFFDSDASMHEYASIEVEHPEFAMRSRLDNPIEEGEAEG
jgi:hypothetical protein